MLGLGRVWYGIRVMSSFPPQMENGTSWLGLRLETRLTNSTAGLEEVAVTRASRRSVVV